MFFQMFVSTFLKIDRSSTIQIAITLIVDVDLLIWQISSQLVRLTSEPAKCKIVDRTKNTMAECEFVKSSHRGGNSH